MDQLASSFADLLESTAKKIRSLTVDKVHYGLKVAAFGLVAVTLVSMSATLLVRSGFYLLAGFIGVTLTYASFGGLFVLAGALVWFRRDNGTR